MSSLRFYAIAVFAIMATAAAATGYSGAADACGAAPAALLFGNTTTGNCAKAQACMTAYCSCVGAAAPTGFTCGAFSGAKPNCSVTAACIATKMLCIATAADDTVACAGLKDVKMSNLAVVSGNLYNSTVGYKACTYEACKMLNGSALGGNCSLDFGVLCASPVKFVFSLLIKGKWSKILADPIKKLALSNAFAADMSKKLRFLCIVKSLFIKANRRRQTEGNLAVTFEASGVSSNNAELKAAFASAQTDKSFLTSTLAVYATENGVGESFSVVGISAGSASSAVFSKAASKATSKTTGTASPATTAPRGATTTTTTTGSASRVTTTTTGDSDSASGAATQSLMAAVVVAVLGALLF